MMALPLHLAGLAALHAPPFFAAAGALVFAAAIGLVWRMAVAQSRNEAGLARNRARMKETMSILPDLGLVLDADGTCLEALGRPAVAGRPDAIAAGQALRAVYPERAAATMLDAIRLAAGTGQLQTCDFTLTDGNGAERVFEARVAPLPPVPGAGDKPAVLALSRDVTGRRERARQRRESVEIFETLFRGSADARLILDRDGRPVEVNAEALRLFGFSEETFRRLNLRDLFADASGDAYRQFMAPLLRTGQVRREEQCRRADGLAFPGEMTAGVVDVAGYPSIQVSIRDIRKRGTAAERGGANGEALTRMARQLAHDYNNVLVGIVGGASLLRMLADDDENLLTRIAEIETAGRRAIAMTRRLQEISPANGGAKDTAPLAAADDDPGMTGATGLSRFLEGGPA